MARILVQANEGDGFSPRSSRSSSDRESSVESSVGGSEGGIVSLRGVQWRIKLEVFPDTMSIDELRRAAANGRRKYAELRRRLLVDPHIMEESQKGSDLSMDNPLSQNPESLWGRFFRTAELERAIENDLSRLYPEHGSYFQSPACQAMLRRILLLRSLSHPEHSYRQGMHELLAPLMYVLNVDVMHLSQMKHLYGDLFNDRFEDLTFQESNLSPRANLKKASIFSKNVMKVEDEVKSVSSVSSVENPSCEANLGKLRGSDELDADVMSIFLGSDAYGAEGELGALLSARFMEHDAYCMFDALLSGQGGAVAMADYFINSPAVGSLAGLPPVIEASSDLYNLLAVADFSLYSHLVELGVEPQYFALRWLRVLFGREFVLEDLLLVWDAIFTASNSILPSSGDNVLGNNIAYSLRSAFILAMAVSMLLHLRSSLLATPNATTCLQKLLNFPQNTDVKKLIEKANLFHGLALDINGSTPPSMAKIGQHYDNARTGKLVRSASNSLSSQLPPFSHRTAVLQHQNSSPCSPNRLRVSVPESYWEQKWRNSMLQKVVPEDSFGQDIEGRSFKGLPIQEHTISNSVNSLETHETGNENCLPSSIAEPDSVLNNIVPTHTSGISSGNSVRRKLLDDKPESVESWVESKVSKFSLLEGNYNPLASDKIEAPKQSTEDTTGKDNFDGNDNVYQNGRHLVVKIGDKDTIKSIVSNEQGMDIVICSDSVKNPDPDIISDQISESLSKLSCDKENKQGTDSLASDSHVLLTNNSGVASSSAHEDKLDGANMAVREELPTNTGGKSSGSIEVSTACTSKMSRKKVMPSDTMGISEVKGKHKSSPTGQFGKFRWIWSFGRNTTTEKSSDELSKTEEENSICSDDRRGLSESRSACQGKAGIAASSLPLVPDIDGDQAFCNSDFHGANVEKSNILDPLANKSDVQTEEENSICSTDDKRGLCESKGVCQEEAGIVASSLPLAPEIDGDQASCNSDVHGANVENVSILEPLVNQSVPSTLSKDNNGSANLRILGQSMLESIQVIESAFSQDCTMKNKDETQLSSTERLDHLSRNFLAGKGQVTALVALTELRKISNILSQM